ncbi:DUF3060 domain-containing protein [Nocardiopsis lambiniae]|uniref:DUF3060 domain-containing protein n=1 Tax=Nocardiopsis lambiniae TaxID=3075539 RepID=A0ABU2M5J4_9ACTN|nr:DUF3060 domain-containing protein [Nocardiopsis sp. DSM 44743]MDT0327914.1 DUF3060 domain-containing protein [Nocardiopsis sp. DSM 44743]
MSATPVRRTPAVSAAALLSAAVFGLTGCSFSLPGGQEVGVDPDGVSVGEGDNEVSVDGEGGVNIGLGGDDVLTIASGQGDVTEDCEGRAVNVVAERTRVVLNGSCTTVTVTGSDLDVHIGSVESVHIVGTDNTVHHASGEPTVTDLGSGNSVSPGGDAAP